MTDIASRINPTWGCSRPLAGDSSLQQGEGDLGLPAPAAAQLTGLVSGTSRVARRLGCRPVDVWSWVDMFLRLA